MMSFLIYCSESEKRILFQHAICIPASFSTRNAQILQNGQTAKNCTAPTLFYEWGKKKKKAPMTQQAIPIANFYDFLPVLSFKSWLNIQKNHYFHVNLII